MNIVVQINAHLNFIALLLKIVISPITTMVVDYVRRICKFADLGLLGTLSTGFQTAPRHLILCRSL